MAIRGLVLCLLAVAAVCGGAPAALAQNPETQELINRLERMQRELTTLQRTVYRGETPKSGSTGTPAPVAPNRRVMARIEVRLSQLEDALRTVTGRAEELEHAIAQFNTRLEKLVSDVDVRLRALETSPQQAGSTGAMPTAKAPPAPGQTAAGGRAPDAPPRPLGSLSKKELAAAPRLALPKRTPKEQYDQAISLMLNEQDFGAAEKALRSFIDAHPKDPLAGNAHYWLGETFYVRKNYQQAAFTFADGFQKFPRGRKAPDNLFKLGMSLAQLGKKKEACTAFRRLLANFPKAKASLKKRVGRERRRLKCR